MNECKTETTNEYNSVYTKMKNGDGPKYITEQLRYVGETQPYHLRNENNFRIPRTITTNMQMSLL